MPQLKKHYITRYVKLSERFLALLFQMYYLFYVVLFYTFFVVYTPIKFY